MSGEALLNCACARPAKMTGATTSNASNASPGHCGLGVALPIKPGLATPWPRSMDPPCESYHLCHRPLAPDLRAPSPKRPPHLRRVTHLPHLPGPQDTCHTCSDELYELAFDQAHWRLLQPEPEEPGLDLAPLVEVPAAPWEMLYGIDKPDCAAAVMQQCVLKLAMPATSSCTRPSRGQTL